LVHTAVHEIRPELLAHKLFHQHCVQPANPLKPWTTRPNPRPHQQLNLPHRRQCPLRAG
jgi:hypothetical protein